MASVPGRKSLIPWNALLSVYARAQRYSDTNTRKDNIKKVNNILNNV